MALCAFQLPSLELSPKQRVVQSRQTSIDYSTCVSTYVTGVPITGKPVPVEASGSEEYAASTAAPSRPDDRASRTRSLLATSSGYYRIWWEDFVGLDLHTTKSIINWTWNGSCVTTGSGSNYWWWQSATFWRKISGSGTFGGNCASRHNTTTAHFRNSVICSDVFLTTNSYYNGVRVAGAYNGTLSAYNYGTSSTGACLPLHWEQELVRTS
jgi:hypothetical protein